MSQKKQFKSYQGNINRKSDSQDWSHFKQKYLNYGHYYKVSKQNGLGKIDFRTEYKKYTVTKPSISYAMNPAIREYRVMEENSNSVKNSADFKNHQCKRIENFPVIKPDLNRSFTPPGTPKSANCIKRKHVSEDREVKRFKCPDGPKTPPIKFRRSSSPTTKFLEPMKEKVETQRKLSINDLEQTRYEPDSTVVDTTEVYSSSSQTINFSDSTIIDTSNTSEDTPEVSSSSSSTITFPIRPLTPKTPEISHNYYPLMFVSPTGFSDSSDDGSELGFVDQANMARQRELRKIQRQLNRNRRKEILREEIQTYVDTVDITGDIELISKLIKLNFTVSRSILYSKFVIKKKIAIKESAPDSKCEEEPDYSKMLPPPPPPGLPPMRSGRFRL